MGAVNGPHLMTTGTLFIRLGRTGHLGCAVRVELLRRLQEALRVLAEFLVYLRMRLQIFPQFGMALQIFLVVRERRVLGEFAGDVAVSFHELVKAAEFAARDIAVTSEVGVFPAVKTLSLAHEAIRIFFVLLANSGMTWRDLLQGGLVPQKLLVVHKRWFLAQLFRDLGRAVKEAVLVPQLLMCPTAVTSLVFPPVKVLLPAHEA